MDKPVAKHVVIAGATGLIGRELTRQLHDRSGVAFVALVRRKGILSNLSDRVQEVLFDFDDPESYARLGRDIPCDVLLCALGTTLKKVGSQQAFRKVDLEYPRALMRQAATLEPKPVFGLVSSIGADQPKGFYLETKAEVERSLLASGLPYVIVRPSLLLGDREEYRLGERLSIALLAKPYLALARTFAPHAPSVWKYAPIEAAKVAEALLRACVDEPPYEQGRVLSGIGLHHPILG